MTSALRDYLFHEEPGVTLYCGDCRVIMPLLPDSFPVSAVISDPPYGSALSTAFHERFTHKAGPWWRNGDRSTVTRHAPIVGDDEPFDPAPLIGLAPKIILWGANWYGSRLPDSGGWLVWDKRHKVEDAEWPMSEAELAWTNVGASVRIFRHMWFGLLRESEKGEHYHPTQKPVALMAWCLSQARLDADGLVLDPYCGSGPTLVAAKDTNRRAIGIEIDPRYCEIAVKRLRQEVLPL